MKSPFYINCRSKMLNPGASFCLFYTLCLACFGLAIQSEWLYNL